MANAPFDAFIGFGKTSFISDDKTWAALTFNKTGRDEGKYDFNGNEFTLQGSAFAGVIDGDNYWLIAVLASGACNGKGGVFEFKLWKQGENGAKGSFDKAAGEAQALQWQKDGCLAAINVNDIPTLKTFVKVASELSIILTNETREIVVRCNPEAGEKDAIDALEEALATYWAFCLGNENADPEEGTPEYKAAILVQHSGLMTQPALTEAMLPSTPLKSITGKVTGHKVECFPFTGTLPSYDAITVTLPKKEEKKASKGNWGSGGSVDPKAVLEAREKFYISQMAQADASIVSLKDAFSSIKASKEYAGLSELILQVMGQ
ncbi:MAG: hypothetical protein V7L31_23060 [Nostoc sp.]|uniref:hypothetical protein n=1 Tax=Nostoc sp. TaxID=1180 RepID=UPI002FF3F070